MEANVAVALVGLGADSAFSVTHWLDIDGSSSREKSAQSFDSAPFGINPFDINPVSVMRLVVHQIVFNGRPQRAAQLCFACRSHAKVSWFRLTDWLAERSLAWIRLKIAVSMVAC